MAVSPGSSDARRVRRCPADGRLLALLWLILLVDMVLFRRPALCLRHRAAVAARADRHSAGAAAACRTGPSRRQ
ncbi:MAG: hypothetical protein WDN69_11510 [Aliidongia sp.]